MKKLLLLVVILLGIQETRAEPFSGSFVWNDYSEHSYSFTTAQDGDVTLALTTGADLNLYGYVVVRDTDGTSLYSTTQGPGKTVNHVISNLRAGSYTVALAKDGRSFYFGSYSGSTTLTPNSVDNDAENNETIDDANPLPLDTTETGHLGYRGQGISTDMIDWYAVTTDAYGDFRVQVTTSGNSIRNSDGDLNLYGGVYIRDSNKTSSLYATTQGPGTDVTHVVYDLRPGTYYIGLEKDGRSFYWGSYTVNATVAEYTRSSDNEPNDSIETANSISVGQMVTGNLGARGQDQETDMDDYWVLSHTGDGDLVFSIRTSGSEEAGDSSDGSLNLYGGVSIISAENPGSSLYWSNQGPGTYQEYRRSNLAAGTYYIRLEKDGRSFYWGTYELELSQAGAAPAPATLTVVSPHGSPTPAIGIHTNDWNAEVSCTAADVTDGTTQYTCVGWMGTGSVPSAGSSNSVTVTMETDSSITWLWQTNYWLDVNLTGSGTVSHSDSWQAAASTQNLTATPASGWLFLGWSGDASGTNSASVTMTEPKTVMANFSSDADGDGLTNTEEAALGTNPWKSDTDGDGFGDKLEADHNWNPTVSDQWAIDYIAANPDTFGLGCSTGVIDVAVGQAVFGVTDGEASLSLQLEMSEDLVTWTNAGDTVEWIIPVDGDQQYFRVRSGQ